MARQRKTDEELSPIQRRIVDALRDLKRSSRWLASEIAEPYGSVYTKLYINETIDSETVLKVGSVLSKSDKKYSAKFLLTGELDVQYPSQEDDLIMPGVREPSGSYQLNFSRTAWTSSEEKKKFYDAINKLLEVDPNDREAIYRIINSMGK